MSKKYFLEETIEKTLWGSRFVVLVPVIVSLIIFLILIFGLIIKLYHLVGMFVTEGFTDKVLAYVISILDISLLSVIILIFAWGIYELFVDEIDVDREHKSKAKMLMVHSIDELKEKIGKVIIILLIVWLFKHILLNIPHKQIDILYIAIVILVMAISLKVISLKK